MLLEGRFETGHLWAAIALNALYLALASALFLWVFRRALDQGTLVQAGE